MTWVRFLLRPLAAITGLAVAATVTTGEPLRVYQVGNSLTVDSLPSENARLLAAATEETVENGFHIRANSSISTIWNRPLDYSDAGAVFGDFLSALPAHEWDHVTMQSFPSGGNRLDDDVRAMSNFMALVEANPANADTTFYVYAPWPQLVDYDEWELNDIGDDANPRVRARRSYYELLTDTLAAERPGRVFMIPAGEVFFEVGQRIEAGDLEGLASGFDLYRDHIHGSEIGQFIAATTVAATIARDDPIGWESVSGLPTTSSDLSLELQEIVWDVLVDRKRSGVSPVGDLNVDTTVDAADYETFVSRYSFRTELSADANGDEVVDAADVQLLFSASAPGRADIDGDGRATVADGAAWAAGYGQSGGSADVNADGVVDAADYSLWRDAEAITVATDFNGDGANDAADLAVWQAEQGWAVRQSADANGDGVVDAADYTLWRDGLAAGATPLSTTVPEPPAFCLLAGALLTIGARAGRRYSSAA